MKRDYFYVWFIPLLWGGFTVFSSFHSGDEHGCFYYGSMAGIWVLYLHHFNSIELNLLLMLPAGLIALAPFGLILDLLRFKKRYWFILFALLFILLFYWQFRDYGSFERMRNKHGYVAAVVVAVCNVSVCAATALSIAGGLVRLLIRRARGKKGGSDHDGPT